MPHFVLPDLLLEPRCSLSVIKNQSQPIGWIIHCLATDAQCALDTGVSPELSDELKLPAEMASLTALYGKLQPGMIYLSCDHSIPGTAGARAPAAYLFLSRAQISALDNTRPGKRHVSFALGAMLWDALQLKKEILGLGVLTVDLRGVLGQGFVSSEEDFFASLLARSAKIPWDL